MRTLAAKLLEIYFSAENHVKEYFTSFPYVHCQFEKAASFHFCFGKNRTSRPKNIAGYTTHAQLVTSQFKSNVWSHHVI